MSRKPKRARNQTGKSSPKRAIFPRRWALFGLALLVVSAGLAAAFKRPVFVSAVISPRVASNSFGTGPAFTTDLTPTNLESLLDIPPEQLGRVDIGLMNLLCAQGLPGSDDLDIPKELAVLDEWADLVKRETRANWNLYTQKPAEYEHSENNFKMYMLVEVLQTHCGIHYNPAWLYISSNKDVPQQEGYASYHDERNIFINGLIEQRMGTCANMATLYVAVARRCGYPVYLVHAKTHFFARWDDGKERFNCEGTNRGMCEPYRRSDEHYRQWPVPITDEEMRDGYFLQDMTPDVMMAQFLFMRGDALFQQRFCTPGIECFMESYRREPQFNEYRKRMVSALKLVNKRLDDLNQNAAMTGAMPQSQNYNAVGELERIKAELVQLQPSERP